MSRVLPLFLSLAAPLAAQEEPNVLWLTVEDMSPWIACYGDDTVPTPNLDRLAAESVRYANAFATSPVCAPARASLVTGCFATRIGAMHMRTGSPSAAALARDPGAYDAIPSYEAVPPPWVRCFPEVLRAAGWYATNAAKTDYQFEAPATVWDASGGRAHWRDRPDGVPFFAVFNHGGTHESRAFPDAARAPAVADPADLTVPPLWPDTPAVRDALARTYDNVARMDAWVGERLAELDAAGLADSTWVFFFSDHGVGLPRGKRSPYDLGTRVPLLVRAPDRAGAGRVEERVVSFVDFGPTVLSLCGIEPDARLDGAPFLGPHARPGSGLAFAHADRFDAVYDRARAVTDGRFRYVRNLVTDVPHLVANAYRERLPMTADLVALRGADRLPAGLWQVASTSRPAEELYDSRSDPWEVDDLAGDPAHAATLARLSAALDAWIADTGDLGLVLPERAMVDAHLWPGGRQPATAAPTLAVADGLVTLACATPGASVGWRTGDGPWNVYREPFPVAAAGGARALDVLAHRIGYAPRTERLPLPGAAPEAPYVVFVVGDEEYRSEESMPMLARILARDHGCRVAVCYPLAADGTVDPNETRSITGLEALADADLMVLFTRFRELPADQARAITGFADSGRPLVGFRTATHAFRYPDGHPLAPELNAAWPRRVFGQSWIAHHGHFDDGAAPLTAVRTAAGAEAHPVLRGVGPFDAFSWLYHVEGGGDALAGDARPLLTGRALRSVHADRPERFPRENPVAWTKTHTGASGVPARVFFTTLGHPYDFRDPTVRRLALQGILWALGREDAIPPDGVSAELAAPYDPPPSGFGRAYRAGLAPALLPSDEPRAGSR